MPLHDVNLEFRKLVSQTDWAIEQGKIGQAFRFFENCCRMKEADGVDVEQDSEILRLAAGILLLRQCEIDVTQEQQPA